MKKRKKTPPVPPERSRGSALTPWLTAVERAVRSIPRGQTASYARVALMAGKPGAARAVVQALHRLEGIPWWRVLRSDGTLAPQVAAEQARRLAKEGVKLGRSGSRVSLTRARTRPGPSPAAASG
ncbi:MAG: MGMT family protein [Archangium sp.]|nr:MGMT family protein [Archangium sp.]